MHLDTESVQVLCLVIPLDYSLWNLTSISCLFTTVTYEEYCALSFTANHSIFMKR